VDNFFSYIIRFFNSLRRYKIPSWNIPFAYIPQGRIIDNYSTRLGIIIPSATTIPAAGLFKGQVFKYIDIPCSPSQAQVTIIKPDLIYLFEQNLSKLLNILLLINN
jgi:hypothetical protein